jgi:acyl carrier protein
MRDENGCLFHKGRKDFQVKIRGFRVELQEVENRLGSLAGVKAAAARAWEGADGETYLAAYVVPDGMMPSPSELRRALSEKLPAYMVPTVFVAMSDLPATPTGKLDRSALKEPKPEQRRGGGQSADRLPSEIEWAITLLWADVLQTRSIGLRDEFLDLGGDSLKASRLLSRVEARFKVKVPFTAFFEASTVEAQAALVSRLTGERE